MSTNPLAGLKIGFIGAGNMARSIIGGLVGGLVGQQIGSGLKPNQILVSNPSSGKLEQLALDFSGIQTRQDNRLVAEACDILVLATKPQVMPGVLAELKAVDCQNKLIISVAAGVETQTFSEGLAQSGLSIVRSMPNTPALIGLGATGLFANSHVSQQQKQQANQIFEAVGICEWIEDEAQMDLVTAISGSGPAHYFLFLEAVTEFAVTQGLSEQVARQLASQTALGAASMVQQNNDQSIANLRQAVTSPGGTTAAALESFASDDFKNIVAKALQSSVTRGQELAKQSKLASLEPSKTANSKS